MYVRSHMCNFKLYIFHIHNVCDTEVGGGYLGTARMGRGARSVVQKLTTSHNASASTRITKREGQDEQDARAWSLNNMPYMFLIRGCPN